MELREEIKNMFVSYDSSFEQKTGQQRWFNTSDVASFTTFPDGTVTLDLKGISHPIKLGPFEDSVLDEIIELITSEGQKG